MKTKFYFVARRPGRCVFFFFFGSIALFSGSLRAQWLQTPGPAGAQIKSITASGDRVAALILNDSGGTLATSTDNGNTWQDRKPLIPIYDNGSVLYAFNPEFPTSHLEVSTDFGANWKALKPTRIDGRFSLPMVLVNGTTIYEYGVTSSSLDSGLAISRNGGQTWSYPTVFPQDLGFSNAVVVGTSLLFGTEGKGIFRTTDDGRTFTNVTPPATDSTLIALTAVNGHLFAALGIDEQGFISTDEGLTWKKVGVKIPGFVKTMVGFKGNLVALSSNVNSDRKRSDEAIPLLSTDEGATWTQAPFTGAPPNESFSQLASGSNFLYAFGREKLYRTQNPGASWEEIDSRFVNTNITDIAVAGNRLFTTNAVYVHTSSDKGNSWQANDHGLPATPVSLLGVHGTTVFVAAEVDTSIGPSFIYRSRDNGANWSTMPQGPPIGNIGFFYSDGPNLYVGHSNALDSTVYVTSDDGDHWHALNLHLAGQSPTAMIHIGNILLEGANNSQDNPHVLFRSQDNGATWVRADQGLHHTAINALAALGTEIFAGTEDSGIYISTDQGATWSPRSNQLPSGFAVHDLQVWNGVLIALTRAGLFYSSDHGAKWWIKFNGLPLNASADKFAILDPNIYLATHSYGVWKRPLADFLGVKDRLNPQDESLTVYPNPLQNKTTLSFNMTEAATVKIFIVDAIGRTVRTLLSAPLSTGLHSFVWNREGLPAGIYFVRMESERGTRSQKLVIAP